jgi:hypothetical protein
MYRLIFFNILLVEIKLLDELLAVKLEGKTNICDEK